MSKPCRCLLRDDVNAADLYNIVQDYLTTLPEESCVDDELYHHRLKQCEQCSQLHSGTCGQCGCYVEIRCKRKEMKCPLVPPRW